MQNEIARFSYYFYRIIVELKFQDRERYRVSFLPFFFSFFRGNFSVIILRQFYLPYLSSYVTSLFSLNYAYVSHIFSIGYNLVLRLQ